MGIIVEKLKECDLLSALKIYDDNHSSQTNIDLAMAKFKEYDESSNMHNIVAKIDDEVVGFATIIINNDIVDELKSFLTIWNVGVKKDKRRMGIATKMFEYVELFAKENGYLFTTLMVDPNNEVAKQFYESLGYEKMDAYIKMNNGDNDE